MSSWTSCERRPEREQPEYGRLGLAMGALAFLSLSLRCISPMDRDLWVVYDMCVPGLRIAGNTTIQQGFLTVRRLSTRPEVPPTRPVLVRLSVSQSCLPQ